MDIVDCRWLEEPKPRTEATQLQVLLFDALEQFLVIADIASWDFSEHLQILADVNAKFQKLRALGRS
jgi:hypothetical protein